MLGALEVLLQHLRPIRLKDRVVLLRSDNNRASPTGATRAPVNWLQAAAPVNGLDQRGVSRPQGAVCDVGAYEFVETPTAVVLASIETATSPNDAWPQRLLLLLSFLVTIFAVKTGVRLLKA